MRTLLCLLGCAALLGCGGDKDDTSGQPTPESDVSEATDATPEADTQPPELTPLEKATAALSATRMKADVDFLADDALGGRIPGSPGSQMAREHIADAMAAMGLEPFGDNGTFFHEFVAPADKGSWQLDADGSISENTHGGGVNVVGLLRGTDPARADEYVVYVAHYDHLGVTQTGEVFNGAFDDAGGVAVGLEVARVLVEQEAATGRSIVFLFSDGEERGLQGAEYWLTAPPIPHEDIVAAISGDPLGRRMLPDFSVIGLSGAETSPDLLAFLRETDDLVDSTLVFINRAMILLFASDQDEFHNVGVPAVWMVNIGFAAYHTVDDEAVTIDYRMMLENARWLTGALHRLGQGTDRFEYEGPKALDVQSAKDVQKLGEGIRGSKVLSTEERERLEVLMGELKEIIDAGSWDVLESVDAWLGGTLFFLVLELPKVHPGEIPPPFPTEG